MGKFTALENLKNKNEKVNQKIYIKYGKALEPLKNECNSHKFFFVEDKGKIKGKNLELHFIEVAQDIFKLEFADSQTDDNIIRIADEAYFVFMKNFIDHKTKVHWINDLEKKVASKNISIADAKGLIEKEVDSYKLPHAGYLKFFNSKIRVAMYERAGEDYAKSKDHSPQKANKTFIKLAKGNISDIQNILPKDQIPVFDKLITSLPLGIDALEKFVSKSSANDTLMKAPPIEGLIEKIKAWTEGQEKEEIKKLQIQWLQDYRTELIKSFTKAVNTIHSGDDNASDDFYDKQASCVQIIGSHLEQLIPLKDIREVYNKSLDEAIKTKLEATQAATPLAYRTVVLGANFKQDVGGNFSADFKTELKKQSLDLSNLRNTLTSYSEAGEDLPIELIETYVLDISWDEIKIAGVAKIPANHPNFESLVDDATLPKFPLNAITCDAYQKYSAFLADYITPLVLSRLPVNQIQALDDLWVQRWEAPFNRSINPTIVKFKALSSSKQKKELEAYTDIVLATLFKDYGLNYDLSATNTTTLCTTWLEKSGENLSIFEKGKWWAEVIGKLNDLTQLGATFATLKNNIDNIKDNKFIFDGVFTDAVSSFEKFEAISTTLEGAFVGIGALTDVGVAVYTTSVYKKSKGDGVSAWKESMKELPGFGALPIAIDKIHAARKDFQKYEALTKDYEEKLNLLDRTNQDHELEIQHLDEHILRYTAAKKNLWKKFKENLGKFISKVMHYISVVLTLIPTGITQVIGALIGVVNTLRSLGKFLFKYVFFKDFRKKNKQERALIANCMIKDAFETKNDPSSSSNVLDLELQEDAFALMWRAGIYKNQQIVEKLTLYPNDPIIDKQSRSLESIKDLKDRIQEISSIDARSLDDTRYMLLRVLMKRFMTDYFQYN